MKNMKRASSRLVQYSVVFVLTAAGVLGACAGTQSGEKTSASQVESPAPLSFDDMSSGEKMQHMKTVVTPKMKGVFAKSPEPAEEQFSCMTCHGESAEKGDFSMPNASLKKLDDEEIAEHPQMSQFMKEEIVPAMAELLGEKEFGCFHCHMHADE